MAAQEDAAHLRRAAACVHRHLAPGPSGEGVEHSRWRYGPMNRGHDPLRG